ncbi:MAG: NAD(P)/FAD-dependent oxidoreductase [Kiritimatiellae bacterium]|nr:NAD(P)/FAD-dependent oxidoreductase [Kiritimatiellia bacterium]
MKEMKAHSSFQMRPLAHKPVSLAVIGGGAAGLFAAAAAARRSLGCLVLERKARPGAKMLMTANGRCNFTKDVSAERMLADIGEPVASFVRPALTAFPPSRIAAAFRLCGVKTRRMPDGRLFPASGQAATVVHALGDLLRDEGVPIAVNCPVVGVQPVKRGFIVATRHFTIWAENVLVATGGVSFPKTGSVGDGQEFARALGHRIVPYRAGLTGFETNDPRVRSRSGLRFEDGSAKILDGAGRVLHSCRGEVDCEPWGVGGAAVYNCQRLTARHSGPFSVVVEFDGQRLTLANPAPRPVKESIVTIGGVSTDDVDPDTMESRKVPGLFFAGEVLDIDGPTGGYNLSLAFATAHLAVRTCFARTKSGASVVRQLRHMV